MLEPWITPKFFKEVNVGENLDKIVDEWTHAEYLDQEFYMDRMVDHWSSFVAEEDFAKISSAGISHVRVPVSYWYWDVEEGEPFPPPNMDDMDQRSPLFYLKRALMWMEKYGMAASMDLHSGPGSQNGYDNSGRRGEIHWVDQSYPENRDNVDRTLRILDKMAGTLSKWVDEGTIKIDTLYGMGILNEPHICGPWYDEDKFGSACMDDFYPKAYDVIRQYFMPEEVKMVIDIAAKGFAAFDGYMLDRYEDLDLDAHHYQCFGAANHWAEEEGGWSRHLEEACRIRADIGMSSMRTWAGEFSLAITDCQEYLQGGFVTPYDPSSSEATCRYYNSDFSTFPPEYKEFLSSYFLAQIDSFEAGTNGVGWFMWTMKTEDHCAPEWDFIFLLDNGIIPEDLCTRPTYCNK